MTLALTTIFDPSISRSSETKRQSETNFEFLERSDRPEIERVRNLIDRCVGSLPKEELDETVARIKSREGFQSICFELILFETLKSQGCEVVIHPELPNGSKKHPDFLVTDRNGDAYYLEAVLASENSENISSSTAMKESVVDSLRSVSHSDFTIMINSTGDPTSAPKGVALARGIISWLDTLDYDSLRAAIEADTRYSLPIRSWDLNGWIVETTAFPVSTDMRGVGCGLVSAYSIHEVGWVDSWTPLKNAIKKKGSRYGDLDLPLIVAVNFDRGYLSSIDKVQALYGQEKYVYFPDNPEIPARIERENNGAWRGISGSTTRRVSGAWFFHGISPYNVVSATQNIYLNPWANIDAPESLNIFPTVILDENSLIESDGITIGDALELPAGWPE